MLPCHISLKKAKLILQKVKQICTNLLAWKFSQCVMTTEPLK